MGDADDVVVLQIGADAGGIAQRLHPDGAQMVFRADAGDLQEMRRVHRAAGEDHLAPRA